MKFSLFMEEISNSQFTINYPLRLPIYITDRIQGWTFIKYYLFFKPRRGLMSVNGITSNTTAADYTKSSSATSKQKTDTKKTTDAAITSGVIYEPSTDNTADVVSSTSNQNAAIVAQLKADAEQRAAQLQSIVQQILSKQGNSYGQATDMWQFLASGDYTVDAATKAQAQADIADDGYWGVNKTSDRILDFAKALSGGDPDKMEEMRKAFEKGFKEATSSWGKDLPSISNSTYDAVMDKFDKYAEENSKTSTEDTI